MPKIKEIEYTPNPNARKFVLAEPLTFGVVRSYESLEESLDDILASKLLSIPHVVSVFYVDNWITITQDGNKDWTGLLRQVAEPIRESKGASEESEKFAEMSEWLQDDSNLSDEDKEKLQRIREVIDMEIRPYLQGDGGDLHLVGLEQNYLQVHYQGACGSCPSSLTGRLSGIQYLVQRIDPNLEVVAV